MAEAAFRAIVVSAVDLLKLKIYDYYKAEGVQFSAVAAALASAVVMFVVFDGARLFMSGLRAVYAKYYDYFTFPNRPISWLLPNNS